MRAFALLLLLLAPAGAAYGRPVLSLGLRVGGGVPYGRTASAASLSDELRLSLPVTAELTFASTPRLSVGPFLQYAPAALSSRAPLGSGACSDTGGACSDARVLRIGWQFVWNLNDAGRVRTWAAVGTAYQSLAYSARDFSGSGTLTYRGWEWLNVQLGAHLLQHGRGSLGPYASASIGRFERVRLASGGDTFSGEIAKKTIHGWLQLGIRATVDL